MFSMFSLPQQCKNIKNWDCAQSQVEIWIIHVIFSLNLMLQESTSRKFQHWEMVDFLRSEEKIEKFYAKLNHSGHSKPSGTFRGPIHNVFDELAEKQKWHVISGSSDCALCLLFAELTLKDLNSELRSNQRNRTLNCIFTNVFYPLSKSQTYQTNRKGCKWKTIMTRSDRFSVS